MHEIMEWPIREINLTALLTQVSTRVPQQWIYLTMHGGHCTQNLLLSSNYFPKSVATGTANYWCSLPWYNISVLYHRSEYAWRHIGRIDLNIGRSGVENGELGTKMSILALLVSKIWRFYPFWVGLGSILKLLEPNFGVTNNLECMKLL